MTVSDIPASAARPAPEGAAISTLASALLLRGREATTDSGTGGQMIRLAFLVDSPSKRAHANVVSRLALGLAETGQAETTIVCYSADPPPSWLPPEVRIHRLGVERVSRSVPSLVRYLRAEQPEVLITRQVHANFVGLAAAWMARVPPRWRGKIVLAQDQFVELCHKLNRRDNKWVAKASYRFADGLVAPSPSVRDNAVQSCRLDPSSAALVPNPIPKYTGTPGSPPHPWLATRPATGVRQHRKPAQRSSGWTCSSTRSPSSRQPRRQAADRGSGAGSSPRR